MLDSNVRTTSGTKETFVGNIARLSALNEEQPASKQTRRLNAMNGVNVFISVMSDLTLVVRHSAPNALHMQREPDRAVACTALVGPRSHRGENSAAAPVKASTNIRTPLGSTSLPGVSYIKSNSQN